MSARGFVLKESDLLPLSLGAALLGTGGGGNPYVGMLRARELLRKGASVEVLPLEAIGDDDWIGSVGGIGAPVVSVEKIKQGQECLRALRGVEEAIGFRVSALISEEMGGSNSIEPILTAAYADSKVVRDTHLRGLGSQSYGSITRRKIRECSRIDIVGGGHLMREVLPWLLKLKVPVCVHVREPQKMTELQARHREAH